VKNAGWGSWRAVPASRWSEFAGKERCDAALKKAFLRIGRGSVHDPG
jgi:hypothetical protein